MGLDEYPHLRKIRVFEPGGVIKTHGFEHVDRAVATGRRMIVFSGSSEASFWLLSVMVLLPLDNLEPRLIRNGYDVRSLVEQFDAKPAEIRQLLCGDLDPARSQELMDEIARRRPPNLIRLNILRRDARSRVRFIDRAPSLR